MKNFYIAQYTNKHPGCPIYMAAELNHRVTEWPSFVYDPAAITVTKDYVLQVTDPEIVEVNFDMSNGDQKIVSQEFLDVCTGLDVPHRSVPVKIILADGSPTRKSYFFFLPGASLALLDRDQSDFEDEQDLENGGVLYNTVYPGVPIYARIDKYVAKDIGTPPLFFNPDIFELVCTEEFKAVGEKLLGVQYLPLNETYRYAPFG
ncbi:hypothetical protein IP92_05974 [Pseudoduganella flava]|uniref:DUF4313 domain-containing protein n=1 Tax=Pseudoduganella flava TaxID=871742 RepID=A0A562P4V7_9BURK|nr:hypothetical protein [Pseudoduganella flava]QGZ40041.1 hypothetical protein GO485_13895 [Pseudoduganella flava]TWI39495.1 hypothetical protein IP92_05974 [Pseudoduganella flava]